MRPDACLSPRAQNRGCLPWTGSQPRTELGWPRFPLATEQGAGLAGAGGSPAETAAAVPATGAPQARAPRLARQPGPSPAPPHPTPPHPTPAFGEIGTTGYGGGLHLGGYLVSLRPSNYPQPLGLLMAIHACARYVLFSLWINWFYYFVIIDTEIFFVSTGFAFTERHNWNNLCFHLKLVFCGFSKVLPLFALPSIPSTVGARWRMFSTLLQSSQLSRKFVEARSSSRDRKTGSCGSALNGE